MNEFDVIVAGAGPGGSTTAAYLAKANKNVLLLDKAKFPRDKTCGDALSGKSMSVIKELGLVQEIKKLPHATITGVLFSSPSKHVVTIPFKQDDKNREEGVGYCMRRIYTDNMLFNAAKNFGAKAQEQMQVQEVIFESGKAVGLKVLNLQTRQEEEFYSKVVVGADGVNSSVAKSVLGKDAELDPAHSCIAIRAYYSGISGLTSNIEIHFIDLVQPGYFWIFPLENNTANVGLGLVQSELKKRLADKKTIVSLFNEAIENDPILKERFKQAKQISPLTGWTLPFGSKKRKAAGDGWVLVGDAASLVDPFSGEGVGNATYSGRLASQIILKAFQKQDFSYSTLAEYEKRLWQDLGPELQTSYIMQKIGSIKWLLDRTISKAATDPKIKEMISDSLASEESKKQFLNPLFYLKILI